jgi:tetratricopeptide (TPR) repeat protein
MALRGDVEVLHSLAWRAGKAGELDAAERLVREGLRSFPASIEFQEQLGAFIVEAESRVRREGTGAPHASRLEEAVNALSAVLSKCTGQKDVARVRFTRAMAYDLLNQVDLAETDYRTACECDASDAEYALAFAVFLERIERYGDAINLVRRTSETSPTFRCRFLLANLLAQRNAPGDYAEAAGILDAALPNSVSADPQIRAELVSILTRLYAALGKHEDALRVFDALPPGYLTEAVRLGLRADTVWRCGRKDDAREIAITAMAALDSESSRDDKRRLAQSLYFLGEHRHALSILKPLLNPTRDEQFKEMALDCAKKVDDDEFITRFCRQLRANGVLLPFCLELEILTLERYSCFDEAIALMQEYLRSGVNDDLARVFRVRLSLIGLRIGRPELHESDVGKLPPPSFKILPVCCATACVLMHGPRPEDAATYAYQVLRQHFSEPEAHQIFVATMGVGEESVVSFPGPTVAGPGSAVHYRVDDSGEEKWVIIEDSPDPRMERGEIGADHILALEMTGKAVGETFFYRRDPLQDRTATVLSIVNKYAYRKLEILTTWEDRFPGVTFIRKYTFAKDAEGSAGVDLIRRALDQREQLTQHLDGLYRTHPLSLTTFARISRSGLLESLAHLGSDETLSVRCCLGNNEEHQKSLEAFHEAQSLVIDPTALATLFFSGKYEHLKLLPAKLIVCSSCLQEYRSAERRLKTEPSSFLGKIKGQYVYRSDNPGDRKEQREEIAKFLETIQSVATVVSGERLIEYSPEARQELVDMFDRPTAECIAEASQAGAVLWSDDFGVAEVAREKSGTRRVWSQLVFAATNEIPRDVYREMTLFLSQWSYSFTRLDPETILVACRKASWDHEAPPLSNVIKWVGAPQLAHVGASQLCVALLPLIWKHGPLIHQRENVTRAFMRALARRQSGRPAVIAIRDSLDGIFGFDVANVDLCRDVVDGVLRERPEGISLPGDASWE